MALLRNKILQKLYISLIARMTQKDIEEHWGGKPANQPSFGAGLTLKRAISIVTPAS